MGFKAKIKSPLKKVGAVVNKAVGEDPLQKGISAGVRVGAALATGGLSEAGGGGGIGKGLGDKLGGFVQGTSDELRGVNDRKAKAAMEAQQLAQQNRERADALEIDNQKRAAVEAADKDRMSLGSKAKTLLTGGTGLQDEDDENFSIARRFLRGS